MISNLGMVSVWGTQMTPFVVFIGFFCVKSFVSTHLDLKFSDELYVFEATRLGDPPEINTKTN